MKYSEVKKMPRFISVKDSDNKVYVMPENKCRSFGILELVKDYLQAGMPHVEILKKIEELENE